MKQTKSPTKTSEQDKSAKAGKPSAKKDPKKKDQPEEPEEQLPPPEKPKTLERFIYVTTYQDSKVMQTLKEIFEEINQKAFNLKSVKEIYTRGLSDEEKDNNEIDYISGFQIIDKNLRITIIEGLTGKDKAMKRVKEVLPKYQMNTKTFMVFADENILFNKRIYSTFNLSMKYIKLRDTLQNILVTYDIYMKAEKYRQIYDAFLNFGSILNAKTMREIANANLFSDAEALLLLERKYADILKQEDMTGIIVEKKKRNKITVKNLMGKTSSQLNSSSHGQSKNQSKSLYSGSDKACSDLNMFFSSADNPDNVHVSAKTRISSDIAEGNIGLTAKTKEEEEKKRAISLDILSHNERFENSLKERQNRVRDPNEIWQRNLEDLEKIKIKNNHKVEGRFCLPYIGDKKLSEFTTLPESQNNVYFNNCRHNYYNHYFSHLRNKYGACKNSYFTYSNHSLALSFPMINSEENKEYIDYIDNKKKWVCEKDFDRYKQPAREKFYFPKINNEL